MRFLIILSIKYSGSESHSDHLPGFGVYAPQGGTKKNARKGCLPSAFVGLTFPKISSAVLTPLDPRLRGDDKINYGDDKKTIGKRIKSNDPSFPRRRESSHQQYCMLIIQSSAVLYADNPVISSIVC